MGSERTLSKKAADVKKDLLTDIMVLSFHEFSCGLIVLRFRTHILVTTEPGDDDSHDLKELGCRFKTLARRVTSFGSHNYSAFPIPTLQGNRLKPVTEV